MSSSAAPGGAPWCSGAATLPARPAPPTRPGTPGSTASPAISWPPCGWASTRSVRSGRARRSRAPRCGSGSSSCARRCGASRSSAARCPTAWSPCGSHPRPARWSAPRILTACRRFSWPTTCPTQDRWRKARNRRAANRSSEAAMRAKRHEMSDEHLRRALAQEAARLMAEHGIRDFLVAKRKAAERFGVTDGTALLPKNSEIESALAEYQRLFGGASHLEALAAQRAAALSAMRYLREFSPRLVGPVLSGTATLHTEVQLHLFADRVESITLKLLDAGIPHEVTEKRVKLNAERVRPSPGVRFEMDDQPTEATVFPTDGIRQALVSPVDRRPMRRANAFAVEDLLQEP